MSEQTSPPRETVIRARSTIEFRAADGDLGPGYLGLLKLRFSPVNEWTEINSAWEGRFMERFAPGAWRKTISESGSKVRALFQHGQDPQVGDKPLGPFRALEENDGGGYAEVALLDTSYNRDLLPGLQEGLYGSSHRFAAMRAQEVDRPERSDHNPEGIKERTIVEARLFELGPVTFPAYGGATAGMRSLTDEFLMSCFRSDPDRLREMFARAADLGTGTRMDSEDAGTLGQMLALASAYIDEQDEGDAAEAAAITSMQSIQASLINLLNVEAAEDEPDEPEDERSTDDAPSTTDAAPVRTSEPERRVPTPRHRGATYSLNLKEGPQWRLP